jgi:hypothetical protein
MALAALQLDPLRQRGATSKNPTLPEVVVPLMEGLHTFACGDYAAAPARIEPVEGRIVEVGDGHAQREVFRDTLLAAAWLERRPAKRPDPRHFWEKARAS